MHHYVLTYQTIDGNFPFHATKESKVYLKQVFPIFIFPRTEVF